MDAVASGRSLLPVWFRISEEVLAHPIGPVRMKRRRPGSCQVLLWMEHGLRVVRLRAALISQHPPDFCLA